MKWKNIDLSYKDRVTQLSRLSPYELLGVSEGCSAEELKLAYRCLIKTYHPDRADPFMSRQCEEIIKLINAAYDRLKGGH